MRETNYSLLIIAILFATILAPQNSIIASAEESGISWEEQMLQDEGIIIVALRNDTLDLNQDGETDAIRVVVMVNTTREWIDMEIRLLGDYKDKQVVESASLSFTGQTNVSIMYDAWANGEHSLSLQFVNAEGNIFLTYQLPTYSLVPALKTPRINLQLSAPPWIETGDECLIKRNFSDETGPRYDAIGTRTFSGAPFTVLDDQPTLDCSHWPAGEYQLKESYRNGLGQTAESWLNLTIHNREAPAFSLIANGNYNSTDIPCNVEMIANMVVVDFEPFEKIWRIQGKLIEQANGSEFDCSALSAGVHLISLEVINNEHISTIEGINLVRLPADDLTVEEEKSLPSRSKGEQTPTESVGWFSIGALGLIVSVLVYIILVRVQEGPEMVELPNLGPEPQILADGSPDTEGLPTTMDDDGVLWRQHTDGAMDWWDQELRVWHRW